MDTERRVPTEPLTSNRDVWEILRIASNQWRVGYSGPCGLDYTAVIAIARSLGVDTDYAFLEKIHILESEILKIIAKKPVPGADRGCDGAQKEKCKIEYGEYLKWACDNCADKPVRTVS